MLDTVTICAHSCPSPSTYADNVIGTNREPTVDIVQVLSQRKKSPSADSPLLLPFKSLNSRIHSKAKLREGLCPKNARIA